MNTLVDFEHEYLKSVLPILLHDHTTGKNIISRNLWQMDGLTGCVPGTNTPCVITVWDNRWKQVLFNDLKEGEKEEQ